MAGSTCSCGQRPASECLEFFLRLLSMGRSGVELMRFLPRCMHLREGAGWRSFAHGDGLYYESVWSVSDGGRSSGKMGGA